MEEKFVVKYRVVGREENGFVTKGEFDTQKEALDLANKLREQDIFYYDWYMVKIPKQKLNYEKDVYGDRLNQWHDSSFEKGDGDSFTYSTKKGTIMYGKDLDECGFFASFTTEKHYMEFAPQKSYKFKTMKEAKEKAMQLLKSI